MKDLYKSDSDYDSCECTTSIVRKKMFANESVTSVMFDNHVDNVFFSARTTIRYSLLFYKIEVLKHSLLRTNVRPCDFWLFPAFKHHPRGMDFEENEQAVHACQAFFEALPGAEF